MRLRVGIVGGSIAGCAVAIAARRAGCEVTVFERSARDLSARGFGIALPNPLWQRLVEQGYLPPGVPSCVVHRRVWLTRDDVTPHGRELWHQPSSARTLNWATLWRNLRTQLPADIYRTAAHVQEVVIGQEHGLIRLGDGGETRCHVVVGADGARSLVRQCIAPGVLPTHARYVLCRGSVAAQQVAPIATAMRNLDGAYVTVMFQRGHAVFYWIPSSSSCRTSPQRILNWAVYSQSVPISPHAAAEPARRVLCAALEEMPQEWADLVRLTSPEAVTTHPVADLTMQSYVRGPLLLAGDAGTIARPHAASGAAKALEDALFLERLLASHADVAALLAAYDKERCPAGNDLVKIGRRIGRHQVEAPPDWSRMTEQDLPAWTASTLAGSPHYLYQQGA